MNKKQAEELVKKHGSIRKAALASGYTRQIISSALGYVMPSKGGKARQATKDGDQQSRTSGRSIKDFRTAYDKSYIVPKRIREGLKTLGAGWDYESDFAKTIQVRLSDLGNFRELFSDHIVQLNEGRRAWAGRKSTANAMREML